MRTRAPYRLLILPVPSRRLPVHKHVCLDSLCQISVPLILALSRVSVHPAIIQVAVAQILASLRARTHAHIRVCFHTIARSLTIAQRHTYKRHRKLSRACILAPNILVLFLVDHGGDFLPYIVTIPANHTLLVLLKLSYNIDAFNLSTGTYPPHVDAATRNAVDAIRI